MHKSTSIHACVLSPASCRFLEASALLDTPYSPATTLLLYPSPTSLPLSHPSIVALLPSITRVVVIESTWQKGGAVYSDPALQLSALPAVHLDPSYESTYWRYQELGRQFLCTLEAMYHLCRELLQLQPDRAATMQNTQLDDLLYLYAHLHHRIQSRYSDDTATAPVSAHREEEDTDSPSLSALTLSSPPSGTATATSSATPQQYKPPPRAWRPNDPGLRMGSTSLRAAAVQVADVGDGGKKDERSSGHAT